MSHACEEILKNVGPYNRLTTDDPEVADNAFAFDRFCGGQYHGALFEQFGGGAYPCLFLV